MILNQIKTLTFALVDKVYLDNHEGTSRKCTPLLLGCRQEIDEVLQAGERI